MFDLADNGNFVKPGHGALVGDGTLEIKEDKKDRKKGQDKSRQLA
jgi:hypothetical protein